MVILSNATTTDPSQWNRESTESTSRWRPIIDLSRRKDPPISKQQPSIIDSTSCLLRHHYFLELRRSIITIKRPVPEPPLHLEELPQWRRLRSTISAQAPPSPPPSLRHRHNCWGSLLGFLPGIRRCSSGGGNVGVTVLRWGSESDGRECDAH